MLLFVDSFISNFLNILYIYRYRIRSDYGNKRRLDVYLGITSPGARVVMWDGNSGDTQQWYVGGDMTIRWLKNDYCLTSNGTT